MSSWWKQGLNILLIPHITKNLSSSRGDYQLCSGMLDRTTLSHFNVLKGEREAKCGNREKEPYDQWFFNIIKTQKKTMWFWYWPLLITALYSNWKSSQKKPRSTSFDFKRDHESFAFSLTVRWLSTQDIFESRILKYLNLRTH